MVGLIYVRHLLKVALIIIVDSPLAFFFFFFSLQLAAQCLLRLFVNCLFS